MVLPAAAAGFARAGATFIKKAAPVLKKGFEKAKPLLQQGFEQAKPLAKKAYTSGQKLHTKYTPVIQERVSAGYAKVSEYAKNKHAQHKTMRLGNVQNMTSTAPQTNSFSQNNNTLGNLLSSATQMQERATALLMQTLNQIASMGPSAAGNSVAAPPSSTGGMAAAEEPPKAATTYSASSNDNDANTQTVKAKKSLPQRLGSLAGKASNTLSEMKTDFKESYQDIKTKKSQQDKISTNRPTTFAESNAAMKQSFNELKKTGKEIFGALYSIHKSNMAIQRITRKTMLK